MNLRIIELIRKCWEATPTKSFGDVIGDITYEASGHTEIVLVSDKEFMDAAERVITGQRHTG